MKCEGGMVEMTRDENTLRLDVGNNWTRGARLEWQVARLTKKQVQRLIVELQAQLETWGETDGSR